MDERDTNVDDRDDRIREALRATFGSPPFPEAEIEARIRASVAGRHPGPAAGRGGGTPWWRGGTARAVLAAAASLTLFIGGAEYGRRTAAPAAIVRGTPAGAAVPVGVDGSVDLPLTIQSAGTRWVATLARFSGETGTLTPEERRMAREVALSALYGAALELLREAGEDRMLRTVAEMVATRREAIGGETPSALSF